jgi:hypothetical protein
MGPKDFARAEAKLKQNLDINPLVGDVVYIRLNYLDNVSSRPAQSVPVAMPIIL